MFGDQALTVNRAELAPEPADVHVDGERTLKNYLDAFLSAGLRLGKLTDIGALADSRRPDAYLPVGARFPRFMLLAFDKP